MKKMGKLICFNFEKKKNLYILILFMKEEEAGLGRELWI